MTQAPCRRRAIWAAQAIPAPQDYPGGPLVIAAPEPAPVFQPTIVIRCRTCGEGFQDRSAMMTHKRKHR